MNDQLLPIDFDHHYHSLQPLYCIVLAYLPTSLSSTIQSPFYFARILYTSYFDSIFYRHIGAISLPILKSAS